MYTSYIGKKFLELYNDREGKSYSAEEFFDEVLHELFFNHEQHFINVANSSFFQKVSEKNMTSGITINEARLNRFHKNVHEDGPSLTTLVGYAAQDVSAGTSGQLSTIQASIDNDDMYASWIGIGLAISMGGGYSVLVPNDDVLWGLYKGWKYYRSTIIQTPNLKGNQIEVWNSYWITHYLSENYNDSDPMDGFDLPDPITCKAEKWKKLGYLEFATNKWPKVIFSLALRFPTQEIVLNCFKFADTNQTLGFIPVHLPEINNLYELKDIIFVDSKKSILTDNELEQLEPFFNFKSACATGVIGLKVLEPDKLRTYMPKGSVMYAQGKEYKFSDEQSYYNYQIFKTWIIAMLKKNELLELAAKAAKTLKSLEAKEERAKKVFHTLSKDVKEAKTLKVFLDKITEVLKHSPDGEMNFKELVTEVLEMPADQFPLFITLIRFEYAYQSQNNK